MKRRIRIEVFERTHDRYGRARRRGYYRMRAGNGEIVMQCAKRDGYSSKAGARRAARRLAVAMRADVEVVDR